MGIRIQFLLMNLNTGIKSSASKKPDLPALLILYNNNAISESICFNPLNCMTIYQPHDV